MSGNKLSLYAQRYANPAHLILKEASERLYNLKVHLLWQSAHIVVGFYGCRWALYCAALYNIGINGALSKPAGICNLLGLSVKDLHKGAANYLSLLLRV